VGKQPTDRGTSGTQRRRRTDGGGLPIGLAVDGAHRHDFQMARATSEPSAVERPAPTPEAPPGRCLAKGSDDNEVREWLEECGGTAPILARGKEAPALTQARGCKARRWVVERTPSGLNRVRRVLIRWDKKGRHSRGFLHWACAYIT